MTMKVEKKRDHWDKIKAMLTKLKEFIRIRLGELRDEINAKFSGIEQKMEDHVCRMTELVTDQLSVIKCRFKNLFTEIGRQNVHDEYGTFGCTDDGVDMHVHDYYDDLSLPNTTIDEQHVEATKVHASNVETTEWPHQGNRSRCWQRRGN